MPPTVTLQLTPDWMDAIPEEYWPLAKQYMEFLEKQHDERILMEYDFHWEEYVRFITFDVIYIIE